MRDRVIYRYTENRKADLKDELLKFSKDKRSPYYISFNDDIEKSVDVRFDGQTLIKFFHRELDESRNEIPLSTSQEFEIFTIETLDLYADTIRTPKGTHFSNFRHIKLESAILINDDFVQNILSKNHPYSHVDYYLGKDDNDCQWHGVIKTWDYPRNLNETVKDHILENFEGKSKIIAVIHGNGGCGKSTFLRHLTIACKSERFRAIWIDDLNDFCDIDLLKLSKTFENYLLILEDWYAYRHSPELTSRFLNRIAKINNIRIIIGDRNPIEEKPYYPYLIENGAFELLNDENKSILKKVIGPNKKWSEAVASQLTTSAINSCPIFILLFVIIRVAEDGLFTKSKSLLHQFKEIIVTDQKKIYGKFPGLALALYYASCLFNNNSTIMSWDTLLRLADILNKNNETSDRLLEYNPNDPIAKALFRYFSLERHPRFPEFFKDIYLCKFHHNLLAEKGLCQPLFDDWYFDKRIKDQIEQYFIDPETSAIKWFFISSLLKW